MNNIVSTHSSDNKLTTESFKLYDLNNEDEASSTLSTLVRSSHRKRSSVRNKGILSLFPECEYEDGESSDNQSKYFDDNLKLSKYRILAVVDKLDHTIHADYDGYYRKLIRSKVDIIKFSLSIFDEDSYQNLKLSYEKIFGIMKSMGTQIPIMISMQYRIMRLRSEKVLNFKKREKLLIRIANKGDIPVNSALNNITDKSNVYVINNEDYFYSKNAELGDKFIVDFGKALFTITKIVYKNGNMIEIDPNDIENELHGDVNKYLGGSVFSNTGFDFRIDDLPKLVDKFYEDHDIVTVRELDNKMEIDYMEVIVNYDCAIPPNRLVQLWKKSKFVKLI
jgi:hypothetical protein